MVATFSAPARAMWRGGEHRYTRFGQWRDQPLSSGASVTRVLSLCSNLLSLLSPFSMARSPCPAELHTLSAFTDPSTKTHAQGQHGRHPVLNATQLHLVDNMLEMEARRKRLWEIRGVLWPTTLNQGLLDRLVAQKQSQAFKIKLTAVNSFHKPCPRFVFYSGISHPLCKCTNAANPVPEHTATLENNITSLQTTQRPLLGLNSTKGKPWTALPCCSVA